MRLSRVSQLLWCAVALIVSTSCEHKDLCFDHPSHALRSDTWFVASYNLRWEIGGTGEPSWESRWPASFGIGYGELAPSQPAGLCVNTYSGSGQHVVTHMAATGGVAGMAVGENSLLLYNDDTEYIVFDDMSASASAKATTRSRSRSSYTGNPLYRPKNGEDERTVTPPDPLFGCYMNRYEQQLLPVPATLDVTLQPLVFTYLVRYEFEYGIEYVGLARGALAGMAESVFLHDGHTGPERATILYDCTVEPWGVQATVNTFGVPDYPNPVYRGDERSSYALNLEVRLRNGRTFSFDFDISAQLKSQPHGGVIIVDGISISDDDGNAGGSGFDVSIDDWGEYNDVIINL